MPKQIAPDTADESEAEDFTPRKPRPDPGPDDTPQDESEPPVDDTPGPSDEGGA